MKGVCLFIENMQMKEINSMNPVSKAVVVFGRRLCAMRSEVCPNMAIRSMPTTTRTLSSLPRVAFSQPSVKVARFDMKASDDPHEAGSFNPCSPTIPLRTSMAFSQLLALKKTQAELTKLKVITQPTKAFILKFVFLHRR